MNLDPKEAKRRTNAPEKAQRGALTSKQIRVALHLVSEGFIVPETALLSKQKFSTYLMYVESLRGNRNKPAL